jgi:hypothetical protein
VYRQIQCEQRCATVFFVLFLHTLYCGLRSMWAYGWQGAMLVGLRHHTDHNYKPLSVQYESIQPTFAYPLRERKRVKTALTSDLTQTHNFPSTTCTTNLQVGSSIGHRSQHCHHLRMAASYETSVRTLPSRYRLRAAYFLGRRWKNLQNLDRLASTQWKHRR